MLVVFVLFFLPFLTDSYEPITIPSVCPPLGKLNTIEPWTGDLVKIKSVNKGSLYTAGTGDDKIYVVHVYGTPYEMGYAHGVLLSSQIKEMGPAFLDYVNKTLDIYLKSVPLKLRKWIKSVGLYNSLDIIHMLTRPYTPKHFYDELKGISDGSGLDYRTLIRSHMVSEVGKGGCSMIGAWGEANGENGFVQLRALDWEEFGPLQKYPTVLVYHPNVGHAFLNNGWAGFISTIAGMSSKRLAVSEKKADKRRYEATRGIPFAFLMRDVLQFDNSLEEGIQRLQNAKRTCSMWMGIGDANEKKFRLIDYYTNDIQVFDGYNVTRIEKMRYYYQMCYEECIQNFPVTDVVYWGNSLHCQKELLHQYYGRITAKSIIEMLGAVQTGRFMSVVYDLERLELFVSNARAEGEKGPGKAFDRQFVKLDVQALFNEPEPEPEPIE